MDKSKYFRTPCDGILKGEKIRITSTSPIEGKDKQLKLNFEASRESGNSLKWVYDFEKIKFKAIKDDKVLLNATVRIVDRNTSMGSWDKYKDKDVFGVEYTIEFIE